MSLLSAIVVGFALGLVLGGRPANLMQVRLRWNLLIFASMALQLALFTGLSIPASIVTVAYLVSGGLALAWLGRNVKLAGVPCMFLGGLSNFLAIAANGGRMPVEAGLLARSRGIDYVNALADGRITSNSSLASSHTQLRWLTDQFLIPPPWPLPTVLSIGDLLIAAGVVWLIAAAMRAQRSEAKESTPLAA
jgi:hypothetical protein